MEPMKRALIDAFATKRLQQDSNLGREMLGEDYDEFREHTRTKVEDAEVEDLT